MIPTLVRTWLFKNNILVANGGSGGQGRRNLLRTIFDSLTTAAGWTGSTGASLTHPTPWTVFGSSNGVTAALDNTNRLVANSDLVFASEGNAHSWIVLQQSGLGTPYQVLFNMLNTSGSDDANAARMEVVVCSGAFTGGSITARPTAVEEYLLPITSNFWDAISSPSTETRNLHIQVSSTGAATRFFWQGNGQTRIVFGMFEHPANLLPALAIPVSAWLNDFSSFGEGPTYANFHDIASLRARIFPAVGNAVTASLFMTSEVVPYFGVAALGRAHTAQSYLDTAYPFIPIGLFSGTATVRGRMGTLVDLWQASVTPVSFYQYPSNGTKQFVQVGDLIVPWNRSTPI